MKKATVARGFSPVASPGDDLGGGVQSVGEFLLRDDVTLSEKLVIKWQFRLCGHFYTALWDAIKRADDENLDRLALGFPAHVAGFRAWAHGQPYHMGRKLREMGLPI